MRNLKRVLALALALVMMLGMMITASAASYTDSAAINEDYAEAVEVLTGMGVFKGQSTASKVFAPKAILTRAEAATLIYRVITGDVKDSKIDLYDYASFADTAEGAWYNGYVTYAANGGYIKGYAGNFMPNDQVTGIQVLAIMLRAMGYGQNGEFEGAAWKDNVLTTADDLKILENVTANDLDKPASRELVAQLLFDAIQAPTTNYTPAFGYNTPWGDETSIAKNIFGLTVTEKNDDWGRPYTEYSNGKKVIYAKIYEEALATYTAKLSECNIATDMGLKKNVDYKVGVNKAVVTVYTNGVADDVTIDVTKTAPTFGAQGRLVEIYEDEVVVIDTYLAQITKIIDEKTDKNGHITREAAVKLDVWYDSETADVMTVNGTTEYAEKTYVLVYVNEAEKYVEIVAEAESFQGAQGKIWYNDPKHTVDDVDYMDAVNFVLNQAGYEKTKHTWFLDQFGNLIGVADIATIYNYAVLKDIIWNIGKPGSAEATLVYMDGTEATVIVDKFDGLATDVINGKTVTTGWDIYKDNKAPALDDDPSIGFPNISSDTKYNDLYNGYALYEVTENVNGTVNLNGIATTYVMPLSVVDGEDAEPQLVLHYENVGYIASATLGADFRQFIDDGEKVYMTEDTEILVREGNAIKGYTYVPYTVAELADYAWETCEIFYTAKTTNGVTIANRVYIKNGVVAADFGEHMFVTTKSYYEVAGAPGISYMQANVDGEDTLVFMRTTLAEYLAKNVGKLFHVGYEWNAYSDDYGMIDEARLINEGGEEYRCDYNGWCDYLAQATTVSGNTIICNGATYTINADTKYIGVDSYDELVAALEDTDKAEGIWVLADQIGYVDYAEVVYVGTKLNTSTVISLGNLSSEIAKAEVKDGKITITLVADKTTCDFTVYGTHANTVLNGDLAKTACDENTKEVVVDAEDGLAAETYTVEVKTSKTHKDYRLAVITEIGQPSKNITCAQNLTGYADWDDAMTNMAKMDLEGATDLAIELANSALGYTYHVYTTTGEAMEGNGDQVTGTGYLADAQTLLDKDNVLVIKVVATDSSNVSVECDYCEPVPAVYVAIKIVE